MNKKTWIIVLLAIALFSIGYAVYRSTANRETYVDNDTQYVVNEPQHGLTLGLCIIAGLCLLGTVPLVLDRRDVRRDEDTVVRRRTTLD